MLDILNFPKEFSGNPLLQDGTWQHARIYELDSNDQFWNRAGFISLSKQYVTNASAALIYLLQKESHALELWESKWGNTMPTVDNFIKTLSAWGRFSNMVGHIIPIEKFWESYDATMQGIISQALFEFKEEGMIKPFTPLLDRDDVIQAICFDDTWNEQNFLIETSTEWILFQWLTMA